MRFRIYRIKLSVFTLLLCSITTFSQVITSAKVNYKVSFAEIHSNEEDNLLEDYYKMAANRLNETIFTLICTNGEALFEAEKTMDVDSQNAIKVGLSIIGVKGEFYTNINDGFSIELRESFGEQFLIKYEYNDLNWELDLNERKQIGDFLCYKATTEYITDNGTKKVLRRVIAWYTPEINLPFGPKNFFGLPGLILELQEHNALFTLESIRFNELNKKEIESIKKPKGKDPVSRKEYEVISKEIAEGLFGIRRD
jgi:GLPGLI family protein